MLKAALLQSGFLVSWMTFLLDAQFLDPVAKATGICHLWFISAWGWGAEGHLQCKYWLLKHIPCPSIPPSLPSPPINFLVFLVLLSHHNQPLYRVPKSWEGDSALLLQPWSITNRSKAQNSCDGREIKFIWKRDRKQQWGGARCSIV